MPAGIGLISRQRRAQTLRRCHDPIDQPCARRRPEMVADDDSRTMPHLAGRNRGHRMQVDQDRMSEPAPRLLQRAGQRSMIGPVERFEPPMQCCMIDRPPPQRPAVGKPRRNHAEPRTLLSPRRRKLHPKRHRDLARRHLPFAAIEVGYRACPQGLHDGGTRIGGTRGDQVAPAILEPFELGPANAGGGEDLGRIDAPGVRHRHHDRAAHLRPVDSDGRGRNGAGGHERWVAKKAGQIQCPRQFVKSLTLCRTGF